ncbi:hemerythrin domain-containing protein [Microbacterium sp. 4R-513]|uniref:hemerythrin domain-containing protein n=1 Tax=Microbacterium sp. 4R-513 TaxID=2567934 RepID=UPI001F49F29C|nr:hemerythrin domain-containing protein [Microbacterium sp. 4R-513]
MSDIPRLVAWRWELREAHRRLRLALQMAQDAVRHETALPDVSRDLLLFCHGFCVSLEGHHRGEDASLFPALASQYPEATRVVGLLRQDHAMISTLLSQLDAAAQANASPAVLARHLEGLAAIMESHFRFEERELEPLLDELELDADPSTVFGPL